MDNSIQHQCRYRRDSHGIWNKLLDWWLLPAQVVLALGFCLGLMTGVNNRVFAINGMPAPEGVIYQSDVSTIVSAALMVVRAAAGAWLSIAGWRMGFIILEKGGVTLRQLDRLITYRLPWLQRIASDGSRHSRLHLFALWAIFLLATPAQFASPLATGAIVFSPINVLDNRTQSSVIITTAGTTNLWTNPYNDFQNQAHNRNYVVQRAGGLAGLSSPSNFQESQTLTFRRRIPTLANTAIGSVLDNVSVPSMNIESLDWITSSSQLSPSELQAVYNVTWDPYFPLTNVSSTWNPFNSLNATDVAMLTIIPKTAWEPEPIANLDEPDMHYLFPNATTYSGSNLVVVLTHRNDSGYYQPWQFCGQVSSPKFGNTNLTTPYLFFNPDTSLPQCYAVARASLTAGIVNCPSCPIISAGLVEHNSSGPTNPLADSLVATSLALMPEVLVSMGVSNVSFAPTWNNLDLYTRGMLSIAYQASWNALSNEFPAPEDQMQTTAARPLLSLLQATVIPWRVFVWTCLNLLVPISGLLLAALQRTCNGKTVRDPVLSALLLDAGPLLRAADDDAAAPAGLCNATSLAARDAHIPLRLLVSRPRTRAEDPKRHSLEAYTHPVLVPDYPAFPDEHHLSGAPYSGQHSAPRKRSWRRASERSDAASLKSAARSDVSSLSERGARGWSSEETQGAHGTAVTLYAALSPCAVPGMGVAHAPAVAVRDARYAPLRAGRGGGGNGSGDRDRDRERGSDRDSDRERSSDRDSDRERSRDRDADAESDRERSRDRDADADADADGSADADRDKDGERAGIADGRNWNWRQRWQGAERGGRGGLI